MSEVTLQQMFDNIDEIRQAVFECHDMTPEERNQKLSPFFNTNQGTLVNEVNKLAYEKLQDQQDMIKEAMQELSRNPDAFRIYDSKSGSQ